MGEENGGEVERLLIDWRGGECDGQREGEKKEKGNGRDRDEKWGRASIGISTLCWR
jgi:hypothetical protein